MSTSKQNIERQVRNIKAKYPDAIIVKEVYTGKMFQGRKEFERILKIVDKGDMIIFDSVSRMSRNAEEGFNLYEELYLKGVTLVFIKEPHINTDSYKKAMEGIISVNITSGHNAADKMINTINIAVLYIRKLLRE